MTKLDSWKELKNSRGRTAYVRAVAADWQNMERTTDLDCPATLPRVARLTRDRKRPVRIEEDTPIRPGIVAWCVWMDAAVRLAQALPRRWVRELTARANTVYAHNERFRRKIRRRGNYGRDYLYLFMRHRMAALLREHRPEFHTRMPSGYNAGHELPHRP